MIFIYPNSVYRRHDAPDTYDNDALGNFVCVMESDAPPRAVRHRIVDTFHRLRAINANRIQINVHDCVMCHKAKACPYEEYENIGVYIQKDVFKPVWCVNKRPLKQINLNLSDFELSYRRISREIT